jgi:Flp pilus assembly secretin CpaC
LSGSGSGEGFNFAGANEFDTRTDITQVYSAVNFLLPSSYVDFLEVRGEARVINEQTLTVTSALSAFIAGDDQIVALVSSGGNISTIDSSRRIVEDIGGGDVDIDVIDADVQDYDRRLDKLGGTTGVFLEITPYVGLASMEMFIEARVRDLSGYDPNGNPIINTRRLVTAVRLLDGEPYVIGGLKRRSDIKETGKAPGLGDIPILGYLFGGETDVKRWSDVLIVVTPKFYTSSQTDIHAPESVRLLAEKVEDGRPAALPHNHFGYDQWLLDKSK